MLLYQLNKAATSLSSAAFLSKGSTLAFFREGVNNTEFCEEILSVCVCAYVCESVCESVCERVCERVCESVCLAAWKRTQLSH